MCDVEKAFCEAGKALCAAKRTLGAVEKVFCTEGKIVCAARMHSVLSGRQCVWQGSH